MTIQVETQDSVECCKLLTTTPATIAQQNPGTTHAPGWWELSVPPETIVGFVTEHPVNITNPNSAVIATVYADGKDPWPHPPPLALAGVADFDIRYRNFLMASALPNPTPQPIVMTLSPAHTRP